MTTTQALSAMLPTVGGALVNDDGAVLFSNRGWQASALNLGRKQGLLKFVLPGERYIYHVDCDLVDTWEVVYDMFNDRVEAESWHRVSCASPYAFGCFKVTGEPVLSNTLIPPASDTSPLREIIIGFVGALRRLRGARNISADLLLCMDLDHEYTRGNFLKDTIWVMAEQGSVADLKAKHSSPDESRDMAARKC
ncbi:hypothetical protein FN846DRAFT_887387 [Sphaerosporella brunnea]|uniref:Uncharacterized protein n=1 Tax=Sphaerosporella brunnea TaxID=1250544 RepID=A0A5J5F6B7_9PEZI|nr:hypothetical protein FN846DRAFT_887387 [Sphaerosporella brunnea]